MALNNSRLLFIVVFACLMALFGISAAQANAAPTQLNPPKGSSCHFPHPWQQAHALQGEYRAFEGKVHKVHALPHVAGQPTFIQLGQKNHQNMPLTLVLWGAHRANFSKVLPHLAAGARVCVSGKVERYQNTPQIVLKYEEQLRLPAAKLLH